MRHLIPHSRKLIPAGKVATPYGVSVPRLVPERPIPALEDAWAVDIDGALTLAGVFDPAIRKAAKAAASSPAGMDKLFEMLALCMPPRVPLPNFDSGQSVRARFCETGRALCIARWTDSFNEITDWAMRGEHILDLYGELLENEDCGEFRKREVGPRFLDLLTAIFESFGETEICCLEAAAFYALSCHAPWVKAGLQWLQHVRQTWWTLWVADRPRYRRLAMVARVRCPSLPHWLAEAD